MRRETEREWRNISDALSKAEDLVDQLDNEVEAAEDELKEARSVVADAISELESIDESEADEHVKAALRLLEAVA